MFILDLKSDFDVILRMKWHQEWDSISHWKKLKFIMKTNQDSKWLKQISSVHYIDLKKVKHEFNIISENELDSLLKEGRKIDDLKMMLYFVYKQNVSNILQVMIKKYDDHSNIEEMIGNNTEIQQLVREFKNIFQNELSNELLS